MLSMFAVATQFVMSRQDFSVFSLSLCRDLVCYVATRLLFPVLESLSRPCLSVFSLYLCHDLKIPVATSKHFFILKYVATLDSFVATRSVH